MACFKHTPPKINIEPKNDGFQMESPLPGVLLYVPCLFWGVYFSVCFHTLYISIRDHRHNHHFSSLYQAEPDELWLVALEETSVLRLGRGKTHENTQLGWR